VVKKALIAFCFVATAAVAQESDTDRRIKELERQIDIITRELEAIKTNQKPPIAEATTQQYGLGAAASKVYRSEPGISIGGYGEFLYQKPDAHGEIATADSLRAVLYTGYKFSDRAVFNSELEVEHANLERGGNVELEFAYLDYLIKPEFNVRGGLVLLPVGLTNEQHEPTAFLGARRPVVEHHIIPSTWSDLGGGVFGDIGRISYRAYVVTGLDAAGFGPEETIREGRQAGGEAAAEDWAAVGRVDYHPFEGTFLGGSLYSGDSGQGAGFGGRVTLGEVHAQSNFRGVLLRALAARGSLGDAAAINTANGLAGEESVGKRFGGWYVEGGYDIASVVPMRNTSLTPFARYERLDTQRRVPSGFLRNPANDQTIFTIGAQFKPVPQTVIKIDWQNIDNRAKSGVNQFNVALGYIF
jgi:hypothetical protein